MNKDLTSGNPTSVLIKFCLPLFGSVIFQQLYNIADSFVAGKFVSEDALAAVGNSYEVTLLFIAFSFGCNIGTSVVTARLFGAKRYSDVKCAVSTAMIASGVLCAILMTVGILFSGPLLNVINTPTKIFADSKLYLDIYIWGFPFVLFYNISTGIFSALGDSKTPFYFLMVSSVSNIGMDVLFTTVLRPVFPRGVDGVAYATLICQGISCILAVFFVFRRLKGIKAEGDTRLFSFSLFGQISLIAIPSILQQSFVSVGNILIQGIINAFDVPVVAGYSAGIKLNNLIVTSFVTLSNGVSNYTAQNFGAAKPERIHKGYIAGLKMVWVICVPIVLLYCFLGKYLSFLFLDNPTGLAMQTSTTLLLILSPFYFIVATKILTDGVLRGVGKMSKFLIATFTDLLLRVVLAKILSATSLGATGIWIAWPIGWIISTAVSVVFYKFTKIKVPET